MNSNQIKIENQGKRFTTEKKRFFFYFDENHILFRFSFGPCENVKRVREKQI